MNTQEANAKQARLEHLVASAPRQISPTHDLWDKIENRLDVPLQQPNPPLWRALTIACSVLLIASLSYLGWRNVGIESSSLQSAQLTTQAIAPVPNALTASQDAPILALIAQIDATHQAQMQALVSNSYTVNWQQSQYSSPVENGLQELQRAGKQIYDNLRLNPTDKQLWQLWLWVQQRELELLQQGQKLPTTDNQLI